MEKGRNRAVGMETMASQNNRQNMYRQSASKMDTVELRKVETEK
jgi:hypothetical protein